MGVKKLLRWIKVIASFRQVGNNKYVEANLSELLNKGDEKVVYKETSFDKVRLCLEEKLRNIDLSELRPVDQYFVIQKLLQECEKACTSS